MGPETHERLSPSKSGTWLACPYSLGAPKVPAHPSADLGTEQHKWAANTLLGVCRLDQVPAQYRDGIAMYVEHVLSNQATPAVERKWQSIEIENFGGTIDCLMVQDGVSVVYDFKTGKWPVEAKDNPQLLCYSTIVDEHFNANQFFGVIVQPNAFKGDKIKVAEYTPRQVELHRLKVKIAAASTEKHTGEHCRFCSFRTLGQCEEGIAYGKTKGWKT